MEIRFILVSHCNYDCYFCLNEYLGTKSTEYSLTPMYYGNIAKSAKKLNINRITLTGGEPTLRKDLFEIVSSIKESANPHVTLITNGHILEKRLTTVNMLDELHVSFHAMNPITWKKVTNNSDGLNIVKNNIISARESNPKMRIKLNIVSLEENNSPEEIERYLDFARNFNLELNVFQEGYFKMLDLLGIEKGDTPIPAKWWNLSSFKPELLENKLRKKIFLVKGVKVGLSYTSTDSISWDSIWVSPKGESYCDIKQETPVLNLKSAYDDSGIPMVTLCLESLLNEAISHQKNQEDQIGKIILNRNNLKHTTSAVPVSNLFTLKK